MTLALLLMASVAGPWSVGMTLPRSYLAAYGSCVATKQPALASRYVLLAGKGWPSPEPYLPLGQNNCSDRDVNFEPMIMAYALADALITKERLLTQDISFSDVSKLEHSYKSGDNKRSDVQFGEASDFGECVIRATPQLVRNLLIEKVDTDREKSAFGALTNSMAVCNPAYAVKFNAVIIRGALATEYYRLAHAALETN